MKWINDCGCSVGSLREEDQGNLQILVQAVENDSLDHEGRGSLLGSILNNGLPFQVKYVFTNSYIDILK
jgi:hypothetical protein